MSTAIKTRVHEFPRPAEIGAVPSKSQFFSNRELSLLEFDARVLDEALDDRNPLLERLKFLSIFSSNLDEFFEILSNFHRRTLSFGPVAAAECATIRSLRQWEGRPIALADAMIAATAIAAEADAVATRDKDFDGAGIAVVNPWAA